MDSLSPVTCWTQMLQLVFSKKIRCHSLAADGSNFYITGPYTAKVASAEGFCTNDVLKVIKINFQNKLQII